MARQYREIRTNAITDPAVAAAFRKLNADLRDLFSDVSMASQGTLGGTVTDITNEALVVTAFSGLLNNERRLVSSSPLTLVDSGPNANLTMGLTLGSTTPLGLGTATPGVSVFPAHEDHVHPIGSIVVGPGVGGSVSGRLAVFSNADGAIDDSPAITASRVTIGPAASVNRSIPCYDSGLVGDIEDPNAWLIDASSHLVPTAHNTQDIGLTGTRPRDVYIGRDLFVTRSMDVTEESAIGSTAAPTAGALLTLQDSGSVIGDPPRLLNCTLTADAGMGATSIEQASSRFVTTLTNSFDALDAIDLGVCSYTLVGTANASAKTSPFSVKVMKCDVQVALNAGDVVNEVVLIDFPNPSITGTSAASAYGLRINALPSSTGERVGVGSNAHVKVAGTNKLQLGRALGITSTISIRALTSTGTTIIFEIGSADEYRMTASGFSPETNGANDLGESARGWGALRLKDTVASNLLRIRTTNTGIGADRDLTINIGNANRTLSVLGNASVDQDLQVTADPRFNTLFLNDSDDSHTVQILMGSNATANRTYTLNLGDANRSMTLSGNVTFPSGSAYTPTNVTTDRSYDANATTLDELADVVGTMIADLQAAGVIT